MADETDVSRFQRAAGGKPSLSGADVTEALRAKAERGMASVDDLRSLADLENQQSGIGHQTLTGPTAESATRAYEAEQAAAVPKSRWATLVDAAKEKYPRVREAATRAAGAASPLVPTIESLGNPVGAGLRGASVALGLRQPDASQATREPADEREPSDEATSISDRSKAAFERGRANGDITGRSMMPSGGRTGAVIPAHWQDASRVTKESQLTPEDAGVVRGATNMANAHRSVGMGEQEGATMQRAAVDAEFSKWNVRMHQQKLAELQGEQGERDRLTAKRLSAADDAMAQYKTAGRELAISKSRLFANRHDTGAAIIGGLGVLMGFAGFITGRGNPIKDLIEMMDGSVQKDIDAQERMMDAAGHRVGLARNALSDATRALGDKAAGRELVRAEQMQLAAAQCDVMMGMAKTDEEKAKLSMAKAAILDEVAKSRGQVAQLTNAQVTRSEKFLPTQVIGPAGPKGMDPKERERMIASPLGGFALAPHEKAAGEYRNYHALNLDLDASYAEALQLRQKIRDQLSSGHPIDAYRTKRELESLSEATAARANVAAGQGAMAREEHTHAMIAIGSFTNLIPGGDEIITHQRAMNRRYLENHYAAIVPEGINPEYAVRGGEVTPGATYQGRLFHPGAMGPVGREEPEVIEYPAPPPTRSHHKKKD